MPDRALEARFGYGWMQRVEFDGEHPLSTELYVAMDLGLRIDAGRYGPYYLGQFGAYLAGGPSIFDLAFDEQPDRQVREWAGQLAYRLGRSPWAQMRFGEAAVTEKNARRAALTRAASGSARSPASSS